MAASIYAKGYNSFSGVDIKAVFGSRAIAELQAISYSVTREKAPLYTMGSADPRSFSRGKRGIAGTLIFMVFDRHALLSEFGIFQADSSKRLEFYADSEEIRHTDDPSRDLNSVSLVDPTAGLTVQAQENNSDKLEGSFAAAGAWFVDQLPPFDVTLLAANEYGSAALMKIFGVEILNEGYGVSIDDIVSEQQMTYVARSLVPWKSLGNQLAG